MKFESLVEIYANLQAEAMSKEIESAKSDALILGTGFLAVDQYGRFNHVTHEELKEHLDKIEELVFKKGDEK